MFMCVIKIIWWCCFKFDGYRRFVCKKIYMDLGGF